MNLSRDLLLQAYLDCTAQVGDIRQLYTVSYVIVMDGVHRHEQAKESKPWKNGYHLQKKQTCQREPPSHSSNVRDAE